MSCADREQTAVVSENLWLAVKQEIISVDRSALSAVARNAGTLAPSVVDRAQGSKQESDAEDRVNIRSSIVETTDETRDQPRHY
jgi:hypothetical protein